MGMATATEIQIRISPFKYSIFLEKRIKYYSFFHNYDDDYFHSNECIDKRSLFIGRKCLTSCKLSVFFVTFVILNYLNVNYNFKKLVCNIY